MSESGSTRCTTWVKNPAMRWIIGDSLGDLLRMRASGREQRERS